MVSRALVAVIALALVPTLARAQESAKSPELVKQLTQLLEQK